MPNFEFYETPKTFTKYLFREMETKVPILGRVCEPCVGSKAIVHAADPGITWVTNDIDPSWTADSYGDATRRETWEKIGEVDWTVSNPPFTPAVEIINMALQYSKVGVAMHLRASIHEVLKTGVRRTWLSENLPNGIIWLPRFAYQRSKTTDKWTTDNVCACWVVWLKETRSQFIRYAPEWVIDELDQETWSYRNQMDSIMMARV